MFIKTCPVVCISIKYPHWYNFISLLIWCGNRHRWYVSDKKSVWWLTWTFSVQHLDIRRGARTNHCWRAEVKLQMCRWTHWWTGTNACTCFQFPPAIYFSLSLCKHCWKHERGRMFERVVWKKTWLKLDMCFRSTQRFKVDSFVLSIALEMILKWNSSKLRPWLHSVCIFFSSSGRV